MQADTDCLRVQLSECWEMVSVSGKNDELAEVDLEAGVGEWRRRGLPPAQSRAERWGAPYHMQFSILFTRCLFWLAPHQFLPCLHDKSGASVGCPLPSPGQSAWARPTTCSSAPSSGGACSGSSIMSACTRLCAGYAGLIYPQICFCLLDFCAP
jgi:hypothetical protein